MAANTFAEKYYDVIRRLAFENFLQYEVVAERAFYRALHALERLHVTRRGQEVSAPQVVDVLSTLLATRIVGTDLQPMILGGSN